MPAPAPLAVSVGDPAGIGPEIVAAAWARRREEGLPPFFAIGDRRAIAAVWDGPIASLAAPTDAAAAFPDALPLVQVDDPGDIVPGEPNLAGARCALDSLELAVGLARNGFAGGLVTGPVSKAQLYAIGFNYPGQTEFVAERCGIAASNAVMMLAGPTLRTVPVTVHVPLADVPRVLTTDLIIAKARVDGAGADARFRHRLPATGADRAQPACRRKRDAGPRGHRHHPAGRRGAGAGGHRRARAARRRHDVPRGRPRPL